MIVLDFLRENPVSALEPHGIYARWSTQNPRKLSLNYDQIEAKDGDPLTEHCRGLVLRQDHDGPKGGPGKYSILARPFRRFYNLGQEAAASIDWATARYETKLDGTLCILYYDPDLDRACVATRSVPDADVAREDGRTFADVFTSIFGNADALVTSTPGQTFLFELTGPGNQIVIAYDDWDVRLLATVDNATGTVMPGVAPRHDFASLAEASAWLQAQPGTAIEGFVVVDAAGNRVKVKNAQYLQDAKVLTTAGSEQGLVAIALSGTADDVLPFLPKPRQKKLTAYTAAIAAWLFAGQSIVDSLSRSLSRKDAALLVKEHSRYASWIGAILDTWTGKHPSFHAAIEAQRKEGVFMPSLVERVARDACGVS